MCVCVCVHAFERAMHVNAVYMYEPCTFKPNVFYLLSAGKGISYKDLYLCKDSPDLLMHYLQGKGGSLYHVRYEAYCRICNLTCRICNLTCRICNLTCRICNL